MEFTFPDNTDALGKAFLSTFTMSWEEFQIDLKDFIASMEAKNHPVDLAFYEQSLFWDRIHSSFPRVSMAEALAFLREHRGPVYFLGEKGDIDYHRGRRVIDFIAEADAQALANRIDQEWYDTYRLAMEGMYDPTHFLPGDLYVFDASMKWCVVFTHETTDWDSELEDPMKAAQSRYCIICRV